MFVVRKDRVNGFLLSQWLPLKMTICRGHKREKKLKAPKWFIKGFICNYDLFSIIF